LKKKYFSSHKLPKQQSTSFWSREILGINELQGKLVYLQTRFLDHGLCGLLDYGALESRVGRTKNYFNFYFKTTKICVILDRFVPTRKALIHSILISEVKDMKRDI
jgi:hypothetical protein